MTARTSTLGTAAQAAPAMGQPKGRTKGPAGDAA